MGTKVGLMYKGKTLLGLVNKLFVFSSVDPKLNMIAKNSYLEADKNKNKKFKYSGLLEGDSVESRLPFKIFFTVEVGLISKGLFNLIPTLNFPTKSQVLKIERK